MSILVISPEPWNGHFVSKHHYAIELARRGHRVVFHGPPRPGPVCLEEVRHEDVKLHVLHAPKVAPGLRHMPGALRRWLEARWLRRLERRLGERVDVVWLFENSRFHDMRFAGDRLKIYHQVDLNQEFHPESAARTADHVFCTSRPIRDRLGASRNDVTIIHHGVHRVPADPTAERHLFRPNRVSCVYVGNLDIPYLDRQLVLRAVSHLPEVDFHFFGGYRPDDPFHAQLLALPNARLHGRVHSARIPAILENADILLIMYQSDRFTDQLSNPHKMMEYMMSGKVVVATYTSEYEPVAGLLAMASVGDDYVALLEKVVRNIDEFNAPDRQAARRAFAFDNTYSKQLDRIAAALGQSAGLILGPTGP